MKTRIDLKTGVLSVIVLSAGVIRILMASDHSPLTNFTPVGAMALFGGCYFQNRLKAFFLPLLTLWLTDLLLNYFVYYHEWRWFYDGFLFTYSSFAFIVLIGTVIKKPNVKNVAFAGISAALLHWIITDFGVWMDGRTYPTSYTGFIVCYVAAIPYLENMVLANLIFCGFMFGVFELARIKYPILSLNNTRQ
jgi:hypothetical protein